MAARERCRFSLGFWRRSSDRRAFAARPISFGRNSMARYRCAATISQGLPARSPHCCRAKLTISASVALLGGPARENPGLPIDFEWSLTISPLARRSSERHRSRLVTLPAPEPCFYEGENKLVIHTDECIDCGVCDRHLLHCTSKVSFGV